MAQVIKLKRSAVAGKTPQTSSLELGELGINTSDGKIYFHRSSSSDDSIQSVLTTDATITGSLKLSGSQHISGSTNVMDDINFEGDISGSLGSTASFDRVISLNTASIGFLIATGSNFATFNTQTGSFASGSDLQVILAESSSYLVNSDTASLGKVTLVSDITGSITSTASFGKIFGDGSDLDNVADPAAISGSFQGGGSNLISGSILSTGSFGKVEANGDLFVSEYIRHIGDANTRIRFTDNKISFDAGDMTFFAVHDDDSAPFTATVNGGGNRINFRALDRNQDILLKTDSEAFSVELYHAGNKKLETTSDGITITGNVTGSITSTASFGLFVGDGTGLTNVSTETGSFASGSDLHQILAESSSYVLESETGSFASGSDVQTISDTYASGSDVQTISDTYASGSDLHQILAESSLVQSLQLVHLVD